MKTIQQVLVLALGWITLSKCQDIPMMARSTVERPFPESDMAIGGPGHADPNKLASPKMYFGMPEIPMKPQFPDDSQMKIQFPSDFPIKPNFPFADFKPHPDLPFPGDMKSHIEMSPSPDTFKSSEPLPENIPQGQDPRINNRFGGDPFENQNGGENDEEDCPFQNFNGLFNGLFGDILMPLQLELGSGVLISFGIMPPSLFMFGGPPMMGFGGPFGGGFGGGRGGRHGSRRRFNGGSSHEEDDDEQYREEGEDDEYEDDDDDNYQDYNPDFVKSGDMRGNKHDMRELGGSDDDSDEDSDEDSDDDSDHDLDEDYSDGEDGEGFAKKGAMKGKTTKTKVGKKKNSGKKTKSKSMKKSQKKGLIKSQKKKKNKKSGNIAAGTSCETSSFSRKDSCCLSAPEHLLNETSMVTCKVAGEKGLIKMFKKYLLNEYQKGDTPLNVAEPETRAKLVPSMKFAECVFRTENLIGADNRIIADKAMTTFSDNLHPEWRSLMKSAVATCATIVPKMVELQASDASGTTYLPRPFLFCQCIWKNLLQTCPDVRTSKSEPCLKSQKMLDKCDAFKSAGTVEVSKQKAKKLVKSPQAG